MEIPFLNSILSCSNSNDVNQIRKSNREYFQGRTSISGFGAFLLLSLFSLSGTAVAQVISGDYFVLDAGSRWIWNVTENGEVSEVTSIIADDTTLINGVDTIAWEFSDGSKLFLSEDQDGYKLHRLFQPSSAELQSGAFVDVTITPDPPVVFVGQIVNAGDTFSGSGTATVELAGVGVDSVPYQSQSTFVGIDSVSVPAGDFDDTMYLDSSLSLSGTLLGQPFAQVQRIEQWVARSIGFVKFILDSNGAISTAELLTADTIKDDIVIDFSDIALWAWMNDAGWLKLNNSSPDRITTGDMDGNGQDDVVADFASTVGGIFVKYNLGGWTQLHGATSEQLTTGDLDNNGLDDVVIDFGASGLWARMNNASWLKLNNASPEQVVLGDLDNNGADDVIAEFGSSGIFVKRNLGGWVKLHNNNPELMAVGDLDNSSGDDLVVDFGASLALWARMNDSSWLKLHNGTPDVITTGDVDGNGADDVLAGFGSTVGGFWEMLNLGDWTQLNPNSPDDVVTGDVTGNGEDDIVADFGTTVGGIFVKRDQGAWVKLYNTSPDSMAPGELD